MEFFLTKKKSDKKYIWKKKYIWVIQVIILLNNFFNKYLPFSTFQAQIFKFQNYYHYLQHLSSSYNFSHLGRWQVRNTL